MVDSVSVAGAARPGGFAGRNRSGDARGGDTRCCGRPFGPRAARRCWCHARAAHGAVDVRAARTRRRGWGSRGVSGDRACGASGSGCAPLRATPATGAGSGGCRCPTDTRPADRRRPQAAQAPRRRVAARAAAPRRVRRPATCARQTVAAADRRASSSIFPIRPLPAGQGGPQGQAEGGPRLQVRSAHICLPAAPQLSSSSSGGAAQAQRRPRQPRARRRPTPKPPAPMPLRPAAPVLAVYPYRYHPRRAELRERVKKTLLEKAATEGLKKAEYSFDSYMLTGGGLAV